MAKILYAGQFPHEKYKFLTTSAASVKKQCISCSLAMHVHTTEPIDLIMSVSHHASINGRQARTCILPLRIFFTVRMTLSPIFEVIFRP